LLEVATGGPIIYSDFWILLSVTWA
jgi:hypothetical protein